VLQDWVHELPFMQQSVLITACRGPDGLPKDHVAKLICRWLRRCFMLSAFEGRVIDTPEHPGGGSFTGPSIPRSHPEEPGDKPLSFRMREHLLAKLVGEYLRQVDEMPHHFQLHILHAAEILGYHHPKQWIRRWWHEFYCELVGDMHLYLERQSDMDRRLSDQKEFWEASERTPARHPGEERTDADTE